VAVIRSGLEWWLGRMKWFVRLSGWALQTLVNCLFAVPVWRAISWCFHGFFGILPYLKINVSHVAVDSDWTQIGRFCLRNGNFCLFGFNSTGLWPWTQIGLRSVGSVSGIMWLVAGVGEIQRLVLVYF